MSRILVVDDEAALRGLVALVCRRAGFEVDEASGGAEALRMLEEHDYEIVTLDLQMPRVNGFEVLKRLRERNPRPFVIVLTALPPHATLGLDPEVAQVLIRKPFDVDLITEVITNFVESRKAQTDRTILPFRSSNE